MAQSEVRPLRVSAPDAEEKALPGPRERRLRRVSVWLMLFFLFQGGLGAVWGGLWGDLAL